MVKYLDSTGKNGTDKDKVRDWLVGDGDGVVLFVSATLTMTLVCLVTGV